MDRRQFLASAGSIALASLAGCIGSGVGQSTVAREVVVRSGPADEGSEQRQETPTDSSALDVTNLIFQRAGDRGVVVAGDVENAAQQSFSAVEVEVTLFDENEVEDDLLDSMTRQATQGGLDPGAAWQWAVKFPNDPVPEIDFYAIRLRAMA